MNLVGNAIKFTERGEVLVRVVRRARSDDVACCTSRCRTPASASPPTSRRLIFEVFEQADKSTTRLYGGTGLGLAIVSKLVTLMDGCVWVESELGRGSAFHFTASFGLEREPAEPTVALPAKWHDLRVLIVDDNATNRQILEEMLPKWGMQPAKVDGGEAALAALDDACRGRSHFSSCCSMLTCR